MKYLPVTRKLYHVISTKFLATFFRQLNASSNGGPILQNPQLRADRSQPKRLGRRRAVAPLQAQPLLRPARGGGGARGDGQDAGDLGQDLRPGGEICGAS